jgi:hypothetical protein
LQSSNIPDNAMTSRVLWFLAAVIFGLSVALFLTAGDDGAAPTDYRVWLLLALATVVATLGNAARAPGDSAE